MRGERLERYWEGYMSCALLSVPGCGWWGCHFFWHRVSNQNRRGSTSAGQLHSSSCVTQLSGLSIPSGWPQSVWVWRNRYTSCYGYSWEGGFWESFPRRFDTMNMTVLLNRNELVLPFTKMVTAPCQSEGQCQEVISDQSFQRKESSPSNSKTTPEYNESSTCFQSPLGEREARLLWVETCRSVTTQGSHKCLGGQSTKLLLLTTSHRKVKRHRLTSWGSYVNLWGNGELRCMLQQFSSQRRQPCCTVGICSTTSAVYSSLNCPGLLASWWWLKFQVSSHGTLKSVSLLGRVHAVEREPGAPPVGWQGQLLLLLQPQTVVGLDLACLTLQMGWRPKRDYWKCGVATYRFVCFSTSSRWPLPPREICLDFKVFRAVTVIHEKCHSFEKFVNGSE